CATRCTASGTHMIAHAARAGAYARMRASGNSPYEQPRRGRCTGCKRRFAVNHRSEGDSPMRAIGMSDEIDRHRRRFLGAAAMAIAAAPLGLIGSANAQAAKTGPKT